MEAELAKEHPELSVAILAIDEVGHEDGMPDVAKTADLPCLQDTEKDDVWGSWGATWRDVYVVNRANEVVAIYNLTENSLADATNYATLEAMLIDAGE
jgi:hypothetical protein